MGRKMNTFRELLESYKEQKKGFLISIGEKVSLNCIIEEINTDYVKVNLLSFDKNQQNFAPTPNSYYVPFHAIRYLEVHKP